MAEDEELRVRKEHPLVGYRHPLLGLLNELDDDHAANVVALVARQEALRPRAKVAMSERHGREARVLDGAEKWAYGVPVVVDDTTVAVLCPIAGRIDPDAARRLSQVEVVATTEPERQRIARACAEAQTITVVPVDAAEFRKHRSLISLWSRSAWRSPVGRRLLPGPRGGDGAGLASPAGRRAPATDWLGSDADRGRPAGAERD